MEQDQMDSPFRKDLRAHMGHTRPNDHDHITCTCGWTGLIEDCSVENYSSGGNSWGMLAGRSGLHWHCKKCGEVVWRYYNVVS